MFIQNGVFREVKLADGITYPLAAGTVLTVNGAVASSAADAYGILPERVAFKQPTGRVYIAVGGTIDMSDPANSGVTLTDAMKLALTGINFIPEPQAAPELPSVSGSDNGKVLKVVSGAWAAASEVQGLPAVTAEDEGAYLMVVDGVWTAVVPEEPLQ